MLKNLINVTPLLEELTVDFKLDPEPDPVYGWQDLLFNEQAAFTRVVNQMISDLEAHLVVMENKSIAPEFKVYPLDILISQYRRSLMNMVNQYIINDNYTLSPSDRALVVDKVLAVAIREINKKVATDERWKLVVPDGYNM